jgi:hypothetical protein
VLDQSKHLKEVKVTDAQFATVNIIAMRLRGGERVGDVHGRSEQHRVSVEACSMAERDRQVSTPLSPL